MKKWIFGHMPFEGIQEKLNELSESGFEIHSVFSITNTHGGVVAFKSEPEVSKVTPIEEHRSKKGSRK